MDRSAYKFDSVYVSDHSESLGVSGYYFHGLPVDWALPQGAFFAQRLQQAHTRVHRSPIPDTVHATTHSTMQQHTGEQEKQARPHTTGQLTQPISHDHIFHTVLGCAGITSDNGGIDPQLNLCTIHTQ